MKTINKILGTIALATTIGAGCKTIEEGVIYKTREYVGRLEYSKPRETSAFESKKTFIQTDSMSFIVEGHLEIEPGTMCYVSRDDPLSQWYFTWNNKKNNKRYNIRGNKRF